MTPEQLQAANNLKYEIEKCKDLLNFTEQKNCQTIRVFYTNNVSLDIRIDIPIYGDIIKDRYEDFIDGVARDLEKKIKSLEKEFEKL